MQDVLPMCTGSLLMRRDSHQSRFLLKWWRFYKIWIWISSLHLLVLEDANPSRLQMHSCPATLATQQFSLPTVYTIMILPPTQ
jgi:hypothetical protein